MATAKFKHKGLRLHRIWGAMKQRCSNPNHVKYPRYGARGIRVCEAWQRFRPFFDWAMAHGYTDALQIDRIDNDGPYAPENCRWVTPRENIRTSTATKLNAEQVAEIRRRLNGGESQRSVADAFGMSNQMVSCIHRRQNWGDI